MTLRDRLRSIVSFGKSAPADPIRWPTGFPFLSPFLTYAGINLTPYDALQVSTVWACVDAITRAMASAPWHVYERNPSTNKLLARPDDNVEWILNRSPNPWMDAIQVKESLLYGALVWGNGYWEIVRDQAGRVVEIWPLMPERVIPRVEEDGTDSGGNAKWKMIYRYTQPTGGYVDLEPNRVFHLRGMSIAGLMGDNVVARAAKTIAMAVAAEQFAASYFANGTIVGSILSFPGKLNPQTIERLRNEWVEWRASPAKAHRPLFLESGMEYKQVENAPEATQLVDVRKWEVEDICRWFGVPPSKIGHLHSSGHTYNNTEYAGIDWVNTGLRPWAVRMQQQANAKFFPQRLPWRETLIDFDWIKEGTRKEAAEADQVLVNAGILSRNEVRERRGFNGKPGGDDLTVSGTASSLENVIDPPEPPAPTPLPGKDGASGEDGKEGPPGKDGKDADPAAVLRVAKAAVAIGTTEKRIKARRRDLEKNTPAKAEELIAKFVDEEAGKLAEYLKAAVGLEDGSGVPGLVAAVLEGEPPECAAVRVLYDVKEAA